MHEDACTGMPAQVREQECVRESACTRVRSRVCVNKSEFASLGARACPSGRAEANGHDCACVHARVCVRARVSLHECACTRGRSKAGVPECALTSVSGRLCGHECAKQVFVHEHACMCERACK